MGFDQFVQRFKDRHQDWFAPNAQKCDLAGGADETRPLVKLAAKTLPGLESAPQDAQLQQSAQLDWAEVAQVVDSDDAEVIE
jgi:hypothetical protein